MRRELKSAGQRGEVALILYASQGAVYGRYGYGPATFAADYSITPGQTAFVPTAGDDGSLTLVNAAEGRQRIPDITNRHACVQPGAIPRAAEHWDGWFERAARPREDMSEGFFVIHQDRDGNDDGFLVYRARPVPAAHGEHISVTVDRLTALTDSSYASLWRFVLSLDLADEVTAAGRSVQEPLRWLLANPRSVRTTGMHDAIWVRLLDIPACLEGRGYSAEGSLTIQVRDAFHPTNAGVYVLQVGPHGARCERSDRDADLVLDVAHLGSVYLGGVSFSELAHGSLVEERRAGALLQADRMFMSSVAPWCTTTF